MWGFGIRRLLLDENMRLRAELHDLQAEYREAKRVWAIEQQSLLDRVMVLVDPTGLRELRRLPATVPVQVKRSLTPIEWNPEPEPEYKHIEPLTKRPKES